MEYERKTLEELNLLDRFLFAEAVEIPEVAQIMLEIILGKEVALQYIPQTEKEVRTSPRYRCVRLDVWMKDTDGVVYDAEVQNKDTKNLPKRSRYYQSLMDSKMLEPGVVDFNSLNPVCMILISPFDLGGKGLYRYTYRMMCEEVSGQYLEDGAVRIFLNTRGEHPECESEEVVELLHYMENTTTEVCEQCKSDRIKKIHRHVERIRSSEEVKVKYMQAWEERVLDIQEAEERGMERGIEQGEERLNQLYDTLLAAGQFDAMKRAMKDKEYRNQLFAEFNK